MTGFRQVQYMLKHLLGASFSIDSSTIEFILCTYLQTVHKLFYYRVIS
jgi:ABC-type microcin C transport system permease subunit YejE